MKAFRLHGIADLRLENVPTPEPGPDEVLIRVSQVGICGSDVHYYVHGRCGAFVVKHPFIMGHEFAGRVTDCGEHVPGWEIGQRVTVDPSRPCGVCSFCTSGRYNLCRSMRYFGTASVEPHADGAFAQYVTAPAANCHALPDSVDDAQAAALEPMSIALHAINRGGGVDGRTVLVTGGGPIGQLVMMIAKAKGAVWVGLSDPLDYPRRFAAKHGADAVFDPTAGDMAARIGESVPGGPDVVFECSGAAPAVAQALQQVAVGGTVVQVGTLPASVQAPANLVMVKELDYVGSFRFKDTFATALEMIASRRIDVTPLITDVLPFEQVPDAMERARSGKAMKVQVSIDSES